MRKIFKQLGDGLREDRALLAGIFAVWLFVVGLLLLKGVSPPGFQANATNFIVYFSAFFLFFVVPVGALRLYRDRPDSPLRYLRDIATDTPGARVAWRGIPMFVALIVFLPAFSALKGTIPLFHPYNWDATWIAVDRAVFGMDAWRLLQPVLGYPLITSILSVFYQVWLLLIYLGGIYFAMFSRDRLLRRQYLISFFAIWTIIGGLMATLFASVGPCFVWPILGNPTFLDQMRYLNAANEHYPVLVLHVQQMLLNWFQKSDNGLGAGITAMPSMHVAQAFTIFLALRRISPKLGLASGLFCAIIYISSIHLAYHYAMDGIVSAATALVIWKVAGLLAKGWAPKEPAPAPAEYA